MAAAGAAYSLRYITTVDTAIAATSDDLEAPPARRLYPLTNQTISYNWPPTDPDSNTRELWLNHDFVSITSLTAGGTTISSSDYVLKPVTGPPYYKIELKDTASNFLTANTDRINAIVIVGTTGHSIDKTLRGTCQYVSATGTEIVLSVDNTVGVGSLLNINSEWMQTRERYWNLTSDKLAANLTAASDSQTVTLETAAAGYCAGETVMVGTEKMLVTNYENSVLTVQRAVDGTVLAAHSTGDRVSKWNRFKVERAAIGSTAAAHGGGDSVYSWDWPPLYNQLTIAKSIALVQSTAAGFASDVAIGEDIDKLQARFEKRYRRKIRMARV